MSADDSNAGPVAAPAAKAGDAWRIHFALLDEHFEFWEGEPNRQIQEDRLRRLGGAEFVLAPAPDAADAIVFLESNGYKDWRFVGRLEADPRLRRHPGRCFTLNYADTPVTFLPGVYANLPRWRQRPDWTRAGGYYVGNPNPLAAEFEHAAWAPRFLFSFRGAASHPVRSGLFARTAEWGRFGPVTKMDRWFNHTPDEQRAYLEEIAFSRFVLCPRGIGGASHRLFEVMRLGRTPVIVADDWAPPEGPEWSRFSVVVAEGNLDSIPERLGALADRSEAMGLRARRAWEEWFAPEVALVRQLQALRDLAQVRSHAGGIGLSRRWRRHRFRHEHGWTLVQRLMRRLRAARPRFTASP
jgi:hypothetical protein